MASLFWIIWQMMIHQVASWDDYTTHMARDGTYGRLITLYAGDVTEGLTYSSRKNETELEYCKVKSTGA